jgi:HPt (histidine-containing phosphotransfer) domain-containing protein
VQEKLNLLLEKHCATIKNTVEVVGDHLKRARDDGADQWPAIEEAAALSHQLKGSSGTAGFRDICVAATALNDHLKNLNAQGDTDIRLAVERGLELYEKLSIAAQAANPQTSSLYMAMPQGSHA